MNAPIQLLHNLCRTTFRRWRPDEPLSALNEIKSHLNKITAKDVGFDAATYKETEMDEKGKAPVSYIELYQNEMSHTMVIFVVKEGGSLPLHDHPGMHGLLKVIHGQIKLISYSETEFHPPPQHVFHQTKTRGALVKTVTKNDDIIASANSDCFELSPTEGNFHEIRPLTEFAAFLDILIPPYGNRGCHYFNELQDSSTNNHRWLLEIPQPGDYYCDVFPYDGPTLFSDD